ncbi:hypothetical protein HELRODRAFT_67895 [Helobdella robusta]|uniref:SLC26A/SulP transporter domain-containing protein n=1 Tax=Helobdella robusta TaxID=6412 RepID=T1FZ73_HELRO|nr:hypothetical protein HELRODRAFT_67895 [Helobdella robusta]ESN96066.1 hypothetical protein HELRODRAFT_67895 [Helobdella robusta]
MIIIINNNNKRLEEFQGDLIAGITVGLTVIPQSIAYAFMAGVPNETGLYAAFMGSFVYVLFGTSKDITLGPSAVSALLTAFFATSPVSKDGSVAVMLAFFVGLVEIGMHLVNFGYFMNFISFPVIKAFSVASAITIACSQVKVEH